MKKQQTQKYLAKRWKKMRQHFKAFVHYQDLEALHQFRVQVKKIRSLLTLLGQHTSNTKLLAAFKPIKKMYRQAGAIRDAALQQEQAPQTGTEWTALATAQNELQKKRIEKLVSKGKKYLRKMKRAKQKIERLHTITTADIQTFYEAQLLHIQQLLAQHHFDEKLHDARKLLKHLLYNKAILQKDIGKEQAIHFKYINELQHLLGQWHDNKEALAVLTPKLNPKSLRPLIAKNKALERAIRRKGRRFISKVRGTAAL